MNILEGFLFLFLSYFFGLRTGISTIFLLRSLFSNNFKISVFMFLNFLIYLTLGPSYIIFTKFYLLGIVCIFFYDKIINIFDISLINKEQLNNIFVKYNDKIKLLNEYYKILSYFYNFFNLLVSLPFMCLMDNFNYLLESYGYSNYLKNNKIFNKVNTNYNLLKNMSDFDNSLKLISGNDLEKMENSLGDYDDEDLDSILNEMLNPKKFLGMANNMRESIGKNKLSNDELDDKMKELGPLLEMFGNPFDELFKDNNKKKIKVK